MAVRLRKEIIENDYCVLCGTCVAACPNSAISIHERRVVINENRCTKSCSICFQICIGAHQIPVMGAEGFEKDPLTALFGESLDFTGLIPTKVFFNMTYFKETPFVNKLGALGKPRTGTTMALLNYMFDKNLIDCVVSAGRDHKLPMIPVPSFVDSKEDLSKLVGTKPILCPVNAILKDVIDSYEKIAVVGLPCHLEGIRRLQRRFSEFGKIEWLIGVPCGNVWKPSLLKQVAEKMGIKYESLIIFDLEREIYKSQPFGQTKAMFFATNDGKRHPIDPPDLVPATETACFGCPDYAAEHSDLTVGSTGGPLGNAICWIRSEKAQELINEVIMAKGLTRNAVKTIPLVNYKKLRRKAYTMILNSTSSDFEGAVGRCLAKRARARRHPKTE